MICPKWYVGQVGQGAKKPYGGFFYQNSHIKKTMIYCDAKCHMPSLRLTTSITKCHMVWFRCHMA